jgi:hypothetical protein
MLAEVRPIQRPESTASTLTSKDIRAILERGKRVAKACTEQYGSMPETRDLNVPHL